MRTTRRTFFAALTSSVAALVAVAKGSVTLNRPKPKVTEIRERHQEIIPMLAEDDITAGSLVFLGDNGCVTKRRGAIPIGIALKNGPRGQLMDIVVREIVITESTPVIAADLLR